MLRIAQIGVGYWGPNILRNLVENKRCSVTAAVDLSLERREYVRRLYPAITVTDRIDDVLKEAETDAIIIATPVASHFDLAMSALEAGKHVLVEKPMAKSVAEVEKIGRLADKKKLVAMAGHTFIFNAAVRCVKALIDSGGLGNIRYIYSHRLNLGRIRTDVDALWNFAPHDVSIIQYWLNNVTPISVAKRGVDFIQKGIDDVVFMNILYPGRIMANIHVSWLDPNKVRSMTVVGSKKMVVYDDVADNKVAIYDKGIDRMAVLGRDMDYDDQRFPVFNYRSGDVLLPKIDFKEPLKAEIDHFIDCIEQGIPCITGIEHAKKVIAILAS
ncbi:MAG TPA: Gfo/Idh/MocA family oxidoreductase [Syntrophales bacterium]|nr:Gfo/Idh/MocA family oxidoreductase [Syntrophales bacterium]